MLKDYKEEIKSQRESKASIRVSVDINITDKKRKLMVLTTEIMENKRMVIALQKTMTHQRLQLESMTKKGDADSIDGDKDNEVSSESGTSDIDD